MGIDCLVMKKIQKDFIQTVICLKGVGELMQLLMLQRFPLEILPEKAQLELQKLV